MYVKDRLEKIKKLRQKKEDIRKRYNEMHEKYMSEITSELENVKYDLAEEESQLRSRLVGEYETTGVKKFDYGLGVRVMKRLEYDESIALEWAKAHKMALKLDKRKFEKLAKAEPMGFVEIKEEPIGTIPREIGELE